MEDLELCCGPGQLSQTHVYFVQQTWVQCMHGHLHLYRWSTNAPV